MRALRIVFTGWLVRELQKRLAVSRARAFALRVCDDLARQLASQVDGLSIGRSAANVIYLSHPSAKQVRLGCAGRNVSNEFYAATDSRKPSPAFINFVASGAAIVFTIGITALAWAYGRLELIEKLS